jgi:hypothetical protein
MPESLRFQGPSEFSIFQILLYLGSITVPSNTLCLHFLNSGDATDNNEASYDSLQKLRHIFEILHHFALPLLACTI